MWNSKRSLILSRVCNLVFIAGVAVVLATGPWLVKWLMGFSTAAQKAQQGWFLMTLYVGGAVALACLVFLYRLLDNISKEQVFTAGNVRLLRGISWFCFAGAGVGLASALYYLPWGIVGLAAAFMGLIVRVVKNVIAQAMALKEENDYTI